MAQGELHIDDNGKKNEVMTNFEVIASHANAKELPLKISFAGEEVMQQLEEFDGTSWSPHQDKKNELATNLETIASHVDAEDLPFKASFGR